MNKIINILETWEKQWDCVLLSYNFSSRNKINKQKKIKESNLLTLTVSCEKKGCLIISKKKQNKTNKQTKKELKKTIKEAIEVMIS